MTSSPGRSNGLHAAAYVALVDLDPQLADVVLDLLRDEGIAAYATPAVARPAAGIVVPRTDRPLDRVYADAEAAPRARGVLQGRLPQLRADHDAVPDAVPDPAGPQPAAAEPRGRDITPDEDEAWAGLVASYDAPAADPVRPWPASEDVEEAPREWAEEPVRPARAARDAEEHYVPPPPPPLPRTDTVTKLAWLGLLGGPVLLVIGLLLRLDLSGWLGILAVGAFVAGFVVLVARMKDRPPTDWGPDDGAVV